MSQLADSQQTDIGNASSPSPLTDMMDSELEERVDAAISALPTECRRVFEMSRFMGKKHAEIAGELGISVSTVKYHIGNALRLLSRDLGKYIVAVMFISKL